MTLEEQTIRDNSDPFEDWSAIIDLNARLLDSLYRLSFHKLNKDDFDYLKSQLEKTPDFVTVYLKRVSYDEKEERFLDRETKKR